MLVKGNEEFGFKVEVIPSYKKSLDHVLFLCSGDYLQITNDMNRLFGKYCGHMTGKTLLVSGKTAMIKFHSNSRIRRRGFLMRLTAVEPPCKK